MNVLGALDFSENDASDPALERARTFARVLSRSHLTTMASFYLLISSFAMATGKRFRDLVEVLLDAHAPDVEQTLDAMGILRQRPAHLIELATYVRARTRISEGESDKVLQWAEKDRQQITALALPVEKAKMINPRPTLAYAEAAPVRAGGYCFLRAHCGNHDARIPVALRVPRDDRVRGGDDEIDRFSIALPDALAKLWEITTSSGTPRSLTRKRDRNG